MEKILSSAIKKNLYAVRDIVTTWGLIITLALGHHSLMSVEMGLVIKTLVTILVFLLIASRQHALAALMHEAAHGHLLTHKKWNDFISDLFCAMPLMIVTKYYRNFHLTHHRYTNSEKDPDWIRLREEGFSFPQETKIALLKFIFKHSCKKIAFRVSTYVTTFTSLARHNFKSFTYLMAIIIFYLALISSFVGWNYFLLYWIIPLFTILPFLATFRSISEHYGLEYQSELSASRDVEAPWWENLFFAPYSLNYHLTHHLHPEVPRYELKELNQQLAQKSFFKENAHRNTSYIWPSAHSVFSDLYTK